MVWWKPLTMSNELAPTRHFSSVKRAREALKAKAEAVLEKYMAAIDMAAASGKYEEALKAYQWLLDHVPAEDGERIFDGSSDKVQVIDNTPRGPLVQLVGITLGGVGHKKALPEATIIDIETTEHE